MSCDFDYFAEFLENPSAPDTNEFFRMVHLWARYIMAHKNEFNYLEDDEWKEIRERLLDELDIRMDIKDDLYDEWEELNEKVTELAKLEKKEAVRLLNRRLDFMKNYQNVFEFREEDIIEFEKHVVDFVQHVRDAELAELRVSLSKIALDKSIAELDEELARCYERTGKVPVLPAFRDRKVYKGN